MLPPSTPAADDPGLRHVYEYDGLSGEETALLAPVRQRGRDCAARWTLGEEVGLGARP